MEGHDYTASVEVMAWAFRTAREERRPVLVHAKVPLLGHHTSGVRREWYRDDLEEAKQRDPLPHLKEAMLSSGAEGHVIEEIQEESRALVLEAFERARTASEPDASKLMLTAMAPSSVFEETGRRTRRPRSRAPVDG